MTPRLRRLFLALFCATFALGATMPAAHTHPHAWIDLKSTVKLDDQGRVTAVVLDWMFGLYYSAFILEGVVDAGTPLQQSLDSIARENLNNLKEFDYFTTIRADGEKQPLSDVTQFETAIHDNRLWMRFEIPLAAPIDPKTQAFTYAVYDPTYYIEILYAEDGQRVTIDAAPESADSAACVAKIIAPTPSMEVIGFAASLDQTQSGGDSLGEQFAETVTLSCK